MTDAAGTVLRDWPARAAGFLGFWLVLAGFDPADLPIGVLAAVTATWASLRLSPPGRWSFRPLALAAYGLRFVRQSVAAGIDVAWRALDPRLPVRPGLVLYRPHLPPGSAQNAFCAAASLVPGTLPSGADENGALVIHCLDADQAVAEQLAAEETALIDALGGGEGHD